MASTRLQEIAAKLPMVELQPYQAQIADNILLLIKNGMTSMDACKMLDVAPSVLADWSDDCESFKLALARARSHSTFMMAEQSLTIADTDSTAMARNRIAVRQWLASKYNKDQFGDKVTIDHNHKHESYLDALVLPDYMKPKMIDVSANPLNIIDSSAVIQAPSAQPVTVTIAEPVTTAQAQDDNSV